MLRRVVATWADLDENRWFYGRARIQMNCDQGERDVLPRFVPDEPFPPYSYVTGRFPHPMRDPAGHSFGVASQPCAIPDSKHWRDCRPYLYGFDLFNHGYYWEAHEAWEGIWHALGRTGTAADFIKGLIKLAAAGVKVREGRLAGVRTHAERAAELFRKTAGELASGTACYFGLSLARLVATATALSRGELALSTPSGEPVEIVFPFTLLPE